MSDGLVLICLLNLIKPETVDMRTVKVAKPGKVVNIFETKLNLQLGMAAAAGMIKMVGINQSAFLEKLPTKLLGVIW